MFFLSSLGLPAPSPLPGGHADDKSSDADIGVLGLQPETGQNPVSSRNLQTSIFGQECTAQNDGTCGEGYFCEQNFLSPDDPDVPEFFCLKIGTYTTCDKDNSVCSELNLCYTGACYPCYLDCYDSGYAANLNQEECIQNCLVPLEAVLQDSEPDGGLFQQTIDFFERLFSAFVSVLARLLGN